MAKTTASKTTKKPVKKVVTVKLPHYHIQKSKDGQFYFTVVARNGKITSNGETYPTLAVAKKGVKDNRKNAATLNVFVDVK